MSIAPGPLSDRWVSERARFLFREVNDRGHDLPLASVTRDGGVEFRGDLDISVWNPGDDTSGYKRVLPGDFVIGLRSFQSGIGHSPLAGLVSPAYTVLRPTDPRLHVPFYRHLFKSTIFVSRLENVAQGIRQGRTIGTDDFKELRIPVPSLDEQKSIANFLDAETARIDALIAKKRRLTELLGDHLQSVVETVLHAERGVPLRRVAELLPGFTFPSDWFAPDAQGSALLRGINVGVGSIRWDDCVRLVRDRPGLDRYRLRVGDLVIGMDRPFVNGGTRVAEIDEDSADALLVQRVCRVRLATPALAVIVRHVLASGRFAAHVEPGLTGVSVPHLSESQIGGVIVPWFSDAECEVRARRLNEAEAAVGAARSRLNQQIELFLEHRQALITAAVTGELTMAGAGA